MLPGRSKLFMIFLKRIRVEVALAGTIVVNGEGNYVCHRHQMVPHPSRRVVSIPDFDQFHFHPAQVIFERGIFSTPNGATSRFSLGAGVDEIKCRWQFAIRSRLFCRHRRNMNLKPNAIREKTENRRDDPSWVSRV